MVPKVESEIIANWIQQVMRMRTYQKKIIPTYIEKIIYKIQSPFMIEMFNKLSIEVRFFEKRYLENTVINILGNGTEL